MTISLFPSQRQKLALVLGMHRSGTSCLTGLLEDIGFSAGQVDRWDPFNNKGNRENVRINWLNDTLLQTAGFAWNVPPPLTWDVGQAISPALVQLRDVLLTPPDPLDPSPSILKDPRILLTLPFWCETSADLRFIGIFRHPWAVACSVAARDTGQSLEDGLALWLAYNERLLQAHRRQPFPLLCFDLPPEDFVQQLRHALQTHFADWIETEGLHLEKLGTFYSEALVHQAASQLGDASMLSERGLELLERVRSLYQTLCHLAQVAPLTVESLPADPARQLAFWLPQADALHKAGQAEAELALCQQALAQVQPQDRAPLWRRVLRLRRTLGNAEALLSDLLRISQECPQDPDLLLKGAEWLEQQGEHSGALQILNIAVERAPQWFLLRLRLGQYLMRSQQPEQACAHLEHARLLGPDNSAAHMALMNCYAKLGQRTAAIDSYHAAAQIHNPPHQAMIEHQWAVILTQWGEREKALEHRQRAVDSPYVLPHMVVAFAQELLALGQRERALQVLSSAQAAGMESPQLSQLLNRCQA